MGIGGFVTGPIGPGTWQPSWSSTPSLGAWPCLRGASAPALPVHQGAQCDVLWCLSGPKSEPAGVGLMVSRSPYQGLARVLQPYLAVISLRSAGPGYEVNFDAVSILVTVSACDCSTPCRGAQLYTQLFAFSPSRMYAPRPRLFVFVAKLAQDRSAKRGHDSTYGRVCWELLACRKVHPFGFLRGRDRLPLLLGLFYAASCRKTRKNRDSIRWSRR